MIHNVLADARTVMRHRDSVTTQRIGVADAREQQQMRRFDTPRTQDNLAGPEDDALALALRFDANRPTALDDHPPHERLGRESQIGASEAWGEISQSHVHPDAVNGIARMGADSESRGIVLIQVVRETVTAARLCEAA